LEAKVHFSKDKSQLYPHWFGNMQPLVTLLFFLRANNNFLGLASTLIMTAIIVNMQSKLCEFNGENIAHFY